MLDRELSCHRSALWKLGLPGVQSVTWWSKGVCFVSFIAQMLKAYTLFWEVPLGNSEVC